jgi:hypothetical protein
MAVRSGVWICCGYVDVPTGSDFALDRVRLWLLKLCFVLGYNDNNDCLRIGVLCKENFS